jgi:hypothetical protein
MLREDTLERALKPIKSKCADIPPQDLVEPADLLINPAAIR